MVLALIFWMSQDLARIAEVSAVVFLVLSGYQIWQQDRQEWIWLLAIGWILFMVVVNIGAMLQFPMIEENHWSYTRRYARLFLFLPAGWFLGGRPDRVFIFLGLALAGLYINTLYNGGIAEWQHLFAGRRVDFDYRNAQHTAVLFAVALIGLLCFIKRLAVLPAGICRSIGGIVWFFLTMTALLIIIGTQTRQVFLALFICLGAAAVWGGVSLVFRPTSLSRKAVFPLAGAGVVLLSAILLLAPFHIVEKRLEYTGETVQKVLSGAPENLKIRGDTIRIVQWRFATQKIMEAPLTGHGGATRYLLLQQPDTPELIKGKYDHFHNGYLEMGVAYGLPGLVVLPLLLGTLARRLLNAWRVGSVSTDFMLFGLMSLLFFAVVNLFESYPMYRTGAFFMCIVGGSIYALCRPWTFRQ